MDIITLHEIIGIVEGVVSKESPAIPMIFTILNQLNPKAKLQLENEHDGVKVSYGLNLWSMFLLKCWELIRRMADAAIFF